MDVCRGTSFEKSFNSSGVVYISISMIRYMAKKRREGREGEALWRSRKIILFYVL